MNHHHYQSAEETALAESGQFGTFDIGLSAALVVAGYTLAALDRQDPRKTQFMFERESGLEREIEAYWSKQLKVSALAYFDALKMLKNRLYSE